MAKKADKKNGKKAAKVLTPEDKLQKEIEDLEAKQEDMPDISDCYPDFDLFDFETVKREMKELPKTFKSCGIKGVNMATYLDACKRLLESHKDLWKQLSVLEKQSSKDYKALEKEIDKKRTALSKLENKARQNTSPNPNTFVY